MSVNLLDYDQRALAAWCAGLGEKPFRARQLLRWIHRLGESDFERMTDLAKPLREKLAQSAVVEAPSVMGESVATDGTHKWLLSVGGGNGIETVFIPEVSRGTLCISSQVGCALQCSFCATGRQGFNRNLTTAEILGQLWWANKALSHAQSGNDAVERPISNVVMMGMGEPLTNFDNVVSALYVMLDDCAYGLSRRACHDQHFRHRAQHRPSAGRVSGRACRIFARAERCAARCAGSDQSQVSAA